MYVCLCHQRLYDLENYREGIVVMAYEADANLIDLELWWIFILPDWLAWENIGGYLLLKQHVEELYC